MSDNVSRRRAAIYSLVGGYGNTALTIVQGLVLVPMYLHYLGPRLYGAWLGSGGVLAWLSMLDMGIGSLMTQRMANAYGRRDMRAVASYFGTGMTLQLTAVAVILCPLFIVSTWVPGWMGISGVEAAQLSGCFILAGLSDGTTILGNGLAALPKAVQRPLAYNLWTAVAGLFGVAATVILLLAGKGLWSLPLGLLVRGVVICGTTAIDAVVLSRRYVHCAPRLDLAVARELAYVSPILLVTRCGNALAGQSEATLVATLIRPELATVFVLTRRIADALKLLLDQFAGAFFPTFGHLWGEGQRERAGVVFKQILSMYGVTATVLLSAYVVLNSSFVGLWVGDKSFGGHWLTLAIAAGFFVSIRNNLVSYLFGATGEITQSSWIVFGEAVLRVATMAVLLRWIGLIGLPLAMLVSGIPFAILLTRRMNRKLEYGDGFHWIPNDSSHLVHAIVIAAAGIVALQISVSSWPALVLLATAWTGIVGLILWIADPNMTGMAGDSVAIPSRILIRIRARSGATS